MKIKEAADINLKLHSVLIKFDESEVTRFLKILSKCNLIAGLKMTCFVKTKLHDQFLES